MLVANPFTAGLLNYAYTGAAELISDTKLPIYKIAQKVGYESMSQFSSAFKRQYGVTPGEYKKMSKTETECPIP